MRSVSPINIKTAAIKTRVETPLGKASKELEAFNNNMKNKSFTKDEYAKLQEQRGKLEDNVSEAKRNTSTPSDVKQTQTVSKVFGR